MTIVPGSPEELAQSLAEANSRKHRIALLGNSTKARMGGPIAPYDVAISTSGLNKVLQYEPRDLTISVGAGISYCELSRVLAEHQQMVPLDPPFSDRATMGGIVAANTSGPRRRLYGSARDMVIGMTFATLEGKLIRTGWHGGEERRGAGHGQADDRIVRDIGRHCDAEFSRLSEPDGTRTFVQDFEQIAGGDGGARRGAEEQAAAGRASIS